MERIAFCESTNRQFDADGNVLRGEVDPNDLGKFQINARYHQKEADDLGYDLRTLDGNTRFALWLYEKEGTRPWSASAKCWKNPDADQSA